MARRRKREDDLFDYFIEGCVGILEIAWWTGKQIGSLLGYIFVTIYRLTTSGPHPNNPRTSGKTTWTPPWDTTSTWSWELLQKLEWKRFEEVVCDYYQKLGYRTDTTRMGADGGVDVMLYESEEEEPAVVIQCKAWSNKVGVKPVRELLGVMTANHVKRGIFITTSEYTGEAKEFASGVADLELVDGHTLLKRIQELPPEKRESLLERATRGDFSTPTCPNCNVKMVSREAKKGSNAGSVFWGCRNYPRCRQTFKRT